ncbi:DNA internalization-related competence protein ComEC/Rec2 [Oenococcus oeni]|uniref:DNA internalization-related competence protein ComEC/Rec2 n=1 Tax=Oenococcus oeni TaxID=1247 RepID=UPI001EF9CE7C|nr:DNA internalization-related competence protein ComEC/Rec2 [Oenococcus oeni]
MHIYADEITVDGDRLKAKAYDETDRQKIIIYSKIKNLQEKKFWENNRDNLLCVVNGDLGKPQRPTNFNQFNVRKYFLTQSITNQLNLSSFEKIGKWEPQIFFEKISDRIHFFRKSAIDYFDSMPSPLAEYAKALIIGDVESCFYDQYPGISDLGLIHLFSISGFQVTYFFVFLRKSFKKMYFPKELSLTLIALAIPLFFVFSDSVQSLIRPIIAAELSLFASYFNLRVEKEKIWSFSLATGLLLSPMLLLNLGGQLSYLLSFSLMFIGHLKPFKQGLLMSSVTIPIILNSKFTWHFLSMPANFFAIPIFGIVIMPLIGLAVVLHPFWTQAVCFINYLVALFADLIEMISKIPGKIVFGKMEDYLVIPLVCLILLSFDQRKKIRNFSLMAIATAFTASFCFIHFPMNGEFSAFDIGQGDSLLLRTPLNQKTILIDTGGKVALPQEEWQISKTSSNQAKSIIINYLQSKGINRLDFLLLTHGDMDHVGNAKYLFSSIKIKHLIVPLGMTKTNSFRREIKPYLGKTDVIEVTNQVQIRNFPFRILHPFKSGSAVNEDSIALFAKVGNLNVLTAGDLPQEGEREIASRYPDLKIDLLKFGHHGSKTSSNINVLNHWQVKYGIISAGRHNRYGHPKKETLETISRLKIRAFNTQTNGMIRFVYNNDKSYFQTFTKDFNDSD